MLKYKKRLRNYRIKQAEPLFTYHQDGGSDISVSPKRNLFAFRSHGKPCSCSACQQPENNYHRAKIKRELQRELEEHNKEASWYNKGSIDYLGEKYARMLGYCMLQVAV